MTLQDYFEALVGQFLEVAGTTARNQCVDSVNFYIKFVLRQQPIEWTNARDFPEKADKAIYDWIENTPEGTPQEGDIVVWGGNQYGHIGVVFGNEATTQKFWSFDQNYPTGSACRVIEHTYYNVRGWLRPKVKPQSSDQAVIDQLRAERDTNWNLYQGERQAKIDLEDALDKKNKVNEELSRENETLKGTVDSLTKEKDSLSTSLQSLRNSLDSTKVELQVCTGLMANRKTLDQYKTHELFGEIVNRLIRH